MSEKCCAKVRISGLSFYRTKPCGRNACVERDGSHYCLMHDPVRKQMKRDKAYEEYRKQADARSRAIERTSQCLEACKGMSDPVMRVAALKSFVSKCARDGNIALPPALRSEAHALLDHVNPRSDEPQKSQSTEWPGSSNLC